MKSSQQIDDDILRKVLEKGSIKLTLEQNCWICRRTLREFEQFGGYFETEERPITFYYICTNCLRTPQFKLLEKLNVYRILRWI